MKYEFRGYCEIKEKWVYGYLIADNIILEGSKAYIVDEQSISTWSGTYDKRGKKIFTNDIIISNSKVYRVEFEYCEFICVAQNGHIRPLSDLLALYEDTRVIANDYVM